MLRVGKTKLILPEVDPCPGSSLVVAGAAVVVAGAAVVRLRWFGVEQ